MRALYPLRFREILRNYEFGARWISEEFDKQGLPEEHRLAETWEVCDRPGESSVVTNGTLAGSTLHEVIEKCGEDLLGKTVTAESGLRFPLLIKLLDATNPLGEQVHPDDSLAQELGGADPGKTEAWYMLRTRPGATIHCGTREGVGRGEVHRALRDGTIRDVMEEQPVQPGDAFLLHAGAMHSTRGGVLFYEIMQNSDITISLRGREFPPGTDERQRWAEETLRRVRLAPSAECRIHPVSVASGTNRTSFIFACRYFALERLDLTSPCDLACAGDKFLVLTQIEGSSTVSSAGGAVDLGAGQSCLLPACLGKISVAPGGHCSLLKAYVPDLLRDVIEPLRRQGVPDPDIMSLGGEAARNPLIELIGQAGA
jgi:mannose-6-phosphate isomerase